MTVRTLIVLGLVVALLAGGIATACSLSYSLTPTFSSVAYGPTGQTFEVDVTLSGASAGTTVTFSAIPSTVTLSAATAVTDDDGKVRTFALVPYGVTGIVGASAPYSLTTQATLVAQPLVLCMQQPQAVDNGADIGALGEVYNVSVQAQTALPCPDDAGDQPGPNGPPGVPIVVTTNQPSASGSSGGTSSSGGTASSSGTSASDAGSASSASASGGGAGVTMLTNGQGLASTNIQAPWGANLLVQATGGGAIASASLPGIANPASFACFSWATTPNPGVFELSATVQGKGQPLPAASVAFNVVFPGSYAGTILPFPALTNDAGTATAYLSVPDASVIPVVVEAVVGTAATARAVGVGAGGCP